LPDAATCAGLSIHLRTSAGGITIHTWRYTLHLPLSLQTSFTNRRTVELRSLLRLPGVDGTDLPAMPPLWRYTMDVRLSSLSYTISSVLRLLYFAGRLATTARVLAGGKNAFFMPFHPAGTTLLLPRSCRGFGERDGCCGLRFARFLARVAASVLFVLRMPGFLCTCLLPLRCRTPAM